MNVATLIEQIRAIDPVDDREAKSVSRTLAFLETAVDPFSEEADDHHVTGSAFVMSSRGVILHLHRKLGIWVQPGGHIDAGEDPAAAALRETIEETGLPGRLFEPTRVFHVDVHPGPRGHTHYDLRFVVLSEPVDPSPPEGESPDVFWFDFDDALTRCEPALAPALARLKAHATTFVAN